MDQWRLERTQHSLRAVVPPPPLRASQHVSQHGLTWVRACVRRRRYVRWYGGQGLCGVETEWRVFESVLGSYHHLPPLFFIC
jgi:hypothetical protein